MLLFYICIFFVVEYFRFCVIIKNVFFYWFLIVGWVLGLLDFFFFGVEEVNGVVVNNNEERR